MQQTLADKTHWFTFITASPKALGCILTVVECWKDSVTILLFDAADATELLQWHRWQVEDINLIAAAGCVSEGFTSRKDAPFTWDYRILNPQTVISRNVMMNEGVCASVAVNGTAILSFYNRLEKN